MGEGRGLAAAKDVRFVAIPGDGAGGEGGVALYDPLHASTDVKAYYYRAPVFCEHDMATDGKGAVITFSVAVDPPKVMVDGKPVMRNGDRCEIRYADGRAVPGVLLIDLVLQEVLDVCNRSFDLTTKGLLAESRALTLDPANVRNATAYNDALERAQASLARVRRIGERADAMLQASDQLHDAAQAGIAGAGIVGALFVGSNPVGLLLLAVGGGVAEEINNATRIPIPDNGDDGGGDGFLPGGDNPVAQNVALTGTEIVAHGARALPGAPGALARTVSGALRVVAPGDDAVEVGRGFGNGVGRSVVSNAAPTLRVPTQRVLTHFDGRVYASGDLQRSQRDLRTLASQARAARARLDDLEDPLRAESSAAWRENAKAREQLKALGDEGLDPRKELEALERAATEAADAAAALLAAQRRDEGVTVRLQHAEQKRYECQFLNTKAEAEAMVADAFLWRPGDP